MAARRNTRSTVPTALPKASCRSAPRCARPSRCSPATVRSSRRSTRSASPSAAMAPVRGVGRPLTGKRSRRSKARRHGAPQGDAAGRAGQGRSEVVKLFAPVRLIIAALALVIFVFAAVPVSAQQPSTVNPTADSVKEDQLLKQLRIINGRGSIPDTKSYNIEQPAGRDWRQFHQVTLPWVGAIAILGMLVVLVAFYLIRGMVKIESGRSGRVLVRFNAFERFVHWMTATCFIILASSGLNVTFGRKLLLPLIGPDAFSSWSQWAKYSHNYLSFP